MMQVEKYTISNNKLRLTTLNIGAVIYKLEVCKNGTWQNVVVNFDDINTYLNSPGFIGVGLCGRFAGRIRNATCSINNKSITLDKNFKNNHHIHGGFAGTDKLFGDVTVKENKIIYSFKDKAGQYPGNLDIRLIYTINDGELRQEIYAVSDEDTIFSPTNHTYFNFDLKKDILDYKLDINASKCYYLDDDSLPIKEVEIKSSIFAGLNKFATLKSIKNQNEQFQKSIFIDHPFVLNSDTIKMTNGYINLEVKTNQKSVVIYTGNYMDEITNKMNVVNGKKHMGICLETQMLPDCVNIANNDDAILLKGKEKRWITSYVFS